MGSWQTVGQLAARRAAGRPSGSSDGVIVPFTRRAASRPSD